MRPLLGAIVLALLLPTSTVAQTDGFGLGAILGEPTGVTAKLWLSEHNAITGALAWSFRNDGSLQIQADYLFHSEFTKEIEDGTEQDIHGRAYFYYGIGGRIRDDTSDNRISVRAPLGITYAPGKSSLDFFFEVVPILDVAPETSFDLNAAVGVRFFFGNR